MLNPPSVPFQAFDIQNNGYAGVDFCSGEITADDLHHACSEIEKDGSDSILLTLISDTIESLESKLKRLVALREADELVSRIVQGFHIEGPFLNPAPGYRGAHLERVMIPADVDSAKRLFDAGDGLVRLMTLAPERDNGFGTTRYLADQGIVVSAGHCNPALDEIRGSIDAGLSMVTHFGNGCPVELPRHDNVLQRFLHCREQLWFCFIPDGAHVDFLALGNYIDFVGIDRTIMVTDAIAAAKMPPGRYQLSGIEVEVDASGVARRPGSRNLAGSTITMPEIIANLREYLLCSEAEIAKCIDTNPREALFFTNPVESLAKSGSSDSFNQPAKKA